MAANQNAGRDANRVEEPQPHPVMEQLASVQYCINSSPSWLEAILLGFQHYILTLGNTILIPCMTVPQMGGNDVQKAMVIQTLLFTSGVNTLLQSLFGTRLPSIIGGSYAYLIPTISIIKSSRYEMIQEPHESSTQTMRGIQGALMVTACFQLLIGFLSLWRNVVRLFSPLSIVSLVSFTGLGLYYLSFPMLAKCVKVGLPSLILIIIISQYLPPYVTPNRSVCDRSVCDRFVVLFCVPILWLYTEILNWTGAYDKLLLLQLAAGLIMSTGTFFATARYGSATPVPPSVISRGIAWLGVGTLLDAVCGSVTGSTASVENAGLMALTKIGSRRVIQISAGFMIFFSLLGKFGAILASIPLPIVAALYCIFFGCVCSAGLGHLQFCNLNSFRTKVILGCSFSLGLSLPQYFREYQINSRSGPVHTNSRWFNDTMSVICMSHATVAAAVAVLLDCTLPRREDEQWRDSGSHLWQKFAVYGSDVRNHEFYKLPCRLNKLFPPL